MSKQIKLTLSPFQRTGKPTTNLEWSKESNRINSENTRELTLEELGEAILNGQSFSHGVFSGERLISTFLSSQLIVLDIDNKETDLPLTLGDALNRLAENGLSCNMAYTTFSDSTPKGEKNPEVLKSATRYRLIIMLPEAINDLAIFDSILKKGFYALFPEADKCPTVQFWVAGNNVLHLDLDYELDMELIWSMVALQASSHYTSERRRNECLKNFAAIPSEKMVVEVDVLLNANLFNIYKSSAENWTNSTPIRNYDWEWACSQFNLLNDFIYCKRKIHHFELMYLYLGMRKIEGGVTKWKESVLRNEFIDSTKVISIAYYLEQRQKLEGYPLFEAKISKYAPDDPASAIFDFLTGISKKQSGKIIDKSLPFDMPLDEAEMALAQRFDEFFSASGNGKYILKCATGLGKTEMIISQKDLEGCVIAGPTHKLKIQHSERRANTNGDYLVLPELPELPPDIKHEYDLLMKVGAHENAAALLHSIVNSNNENPIYNFKEHDISSAQKVLREYFDDVEKCRNTSIPVFTTHKKLLLTDFPNHHTVIIDEDIIPSLFEFKSFTTKELRQLIQELEKVQYPEKEEDLALLYTMLTTITNSELLTIMDSNTHLKDFDKNRIRRFTNAALKLEDRIDGYIIGFFNCDNFIVEFEDETDKLGDRVISYRKNGTLPKDKKIILLSATANIPFYEKIFGEVVWDEISNVEQKGKLIQVYNKGLSRQWMGAKKNQADLGFIIEFADERPVITFKKYGPIFKNPSHFPLESTEGFDDYRGKDIVVVGTPHLPVGVYALLADSLGIKFSRADLQMKYIWCQHNGIHFHFMSFEHEGLRAVQFYKIESQLIQACGRARTIREDCQVVLFSKFPLAGFEKMTMLEFKTLIHSSHPDTGEGNSPVLALGNVLPRGNHSSVNSVEITDPTTTLSKLGASITLG